MKKGGLECNENHMITDEITIQNGRIKTSACHSSTSEQSKSKISCDGSWTRFYPSQRKNGGQIASLSGLMAKYFDPLINGVIDQQCSEKSLIDARIRSNKEDIFESGFNFEQDRQKIKCRDSNNDGRSCPEFETRFCCERKDRDIKWIASASEYDSIKGILS